MNDAIDTLAKFFNDIIGAWVPGAVLITGLLVIHLGPHSLHTVTTWTIGAGASLTMAGLLFAAGHALLALHDITLKPLLVFLQVLKGFNEEKAKERQSYKWFQAHVQNQQNGSTEAWGYRDLRSVALSISPEAATIGRRFMFISLLCNGVGTSMLVICIDYLSCLTLRPNLLHAYQQSAPWWAQSIILLILTYTFFRQGEIFHDRAMATPFSIAYAELRFAGRSANEQ